MTNPLQFQKTRIIINPMKHFATLIILSSLLLACSSNKPKETPLMKAENAYAAGDYSNAATQLLPLAKAGDSQAQYTLGYMYYYGQGVKRDRTQGYFWMQQSAKQGNKSALQALELLNQQSRKGTPVKKQ
jgi:TPR repeat protein